MPILILRNWYGRLITDSIHRRYQCCSWVADRGFHGTENLLRMYQLLRSVWYKGFHLERSCGDKEMESISIIFLSYLLVMMNVTYSLLCRHNIGIHRFLLSMQWRDAATCLDQKSQIRLGILFFHGSVEHLQAGHYHRSVSKSPSSRTQTATRAPYSFLVLSIFWKKLP